MKFVFAILALVVVLLLVWVLVDRNSVETVDDTPTPAKTEPQKTAAIVTETPVAAKQDINVPQKSDYTIAGRSGIWTSVLFNDDAEISVDVLTMAASRICRNKRNCKVQFWESNAPNAMLMTDTQANSILASHTLNMDKGTNTWLYDCDKIKSVPSTQCL